MNAPDFPVRSGPPGPPSAIAVAGAAKAGPAILADEPDREIRGGLIVAAAFFVVFLGWAALFRLDAAVHGAGRVIVSGQHQAVQHREGGVVGELLVRDGQKVGRGQVLLRLAAAEVAAQEEALSLQVIDLLARRARLNAEMLGLPGIARPAEFSGLVGAKLAAADQAMRLQTAQFRTRGTLLATQQSVLGQDTLRASEQRQGYVRELDAVREQGRLIDEELRAYAPLAEKGYVSKTRMRALERSKAELAGRRAQIEAMIAQSSASAGQSRLKVSETRQAAQDRVAAELREVEAGINELAPRLEAAKDQLARTWVRAPASGTVVGLSVFTVGGVIAPGQKLMDIVPDRAALVVEARFLPADIDDLSAGQQATVRFSGLNSRSLPPLSGQLTRISADTFTDEKTGGAYFTAEIAVPPDQLRRAGKERGADFALRPGMPVEVLVPLRRRTALQYLVEPLSQTLWKSFREH